MSLKLKENNLANLISIQMLTSKSTDQTTVRISQNKIPKFKVKGKRFAELTKTDSSLLPQFLLRHLFSTKWARWLILKYSML